MTMNAVIAGALALGNSALGVGVLTALIPAVVRQRDVRAGVEPPFAVVVFCRNACSAQSGPILGGFYVPLVA